MVSLPTGSEQPCHLADILPDTCREVREYFEDGMLLLQAERDALADDADISQQWYVDPVLLEDAEAYARFLVRLDTARVIDFLRSRPGYHWSFLRYQKEWKASLHC